MLQTHSRKFHSLGIMLFYVAYTHMYIFIYNICTKKTHNTLEKCISFCLTG